MHHIIAQATDVELFVLAPTGLIAWRILRCVINNRRDRKREREHYGPIDWTDWTGITNHKDQQ